MQGVKAYSDKHKDFTLSDFCKRALEYNKQYEKPKAKRHDFDDLER